MSRPLRVALILSPAFALVAAGAWYAASQFDAPRPDPPAGGRLVVLVVFDQIRGDYPDRWAPLFAADGFERVKRDGVWFSAAHLPYACTSTGPGHASIATGTPPAVHGVVENKWLDRGRGAEVYCANGDRPYERVPMHGDAGGPRFADGGGLSPERLLAPTVADHLRAATAGKGRAFSLALKDRVAVLMGGKEPAGCYCFDTATGEFHTSAYYHERVHPWAEAFNKSAARDRWFGKDWTRLGDAALYDKFAGPDAAPGEPPNATFPHPLGAGPAPNKRYYDALETSPFGNDLLWELAKACVEGENLGRGPAADLLCLGFSANDGVGHGWGPDSHEVLDVTLRSDRLVAEMLDYLTKRLGPDGFTLVVTADHGVCPLPERAGQGNPAELRFHPGVEFGALGEALDEAFGRRDGPWLLAPVQATFPWVYLNRRLMERHGVPPADVEAVAAQWLGNRPSAQAAYPRGVLTGPPLPDAVGRAAQLSYHPDRAGDVLVVTRPNALPMGWPSVGTSHGTPHPYDTHVPVMAVGRGIPPWKEQKDRVSALVVAPIVCRALGLDPPGLAEKAPAGFGSPN